MTSDDLGFDFVTLASAQIVVVSAGLVLFGFFVIPFQMQFFDPAIVKEPAEALQWAAIAFGTVFLLFGIPIFSFSLFVSALSRVVDWCCKPTILVPDTDQKLTGGVP